MGEKYGYICNNCGYEAECSPTIDWGFIAVVRAYVCQDCNSLFDAIIGYKGEEYSRDEAIAKNLPNAKSFYRCEE